MACRAPATLVEAHSEAEVIATFARARAAGLRVGLRGSGASYGDAALSDGQIILDCTRMRRILEWDPERGILRAEAGATIEDLWRTTVADGFWPPVVSGTMVPTLGGALAMNIHGKNCWRAGPIGDHVVRLRAVFPDGSVRVLEPDKERDLFEAVIGSFGTLACITEVTLRMKRIGSGMVEVTAAYARDLDALFRCFEENLESAEYLVGWIDAFGRGPGIGRGIAHWARHLEASEVPKAAQSLSPSAQELPGRLFGLIPKRWMWRLLKPFSNRLGMRLLNFAKLTLSRIMDRPRTYRQSLGAFNFLLDYVPNWKWVYRPAGFIQHQSFIPAATARAAFTRILELGHEHGWPAYLAVLKRHRPDRFLLSHGLDGYSLALDFPVPRRDRERLLRLTAAIDSVVIEAGGRFYAAKDATLAAESFGRSLPPEARARFLDLKARLDPEELLQTDLYRRLFHGAPLNRGLR